MRFKRPRRRVCRPPRKEPGDERSSSTANSVGAGTVRTQCCGAVSASIWTGGNSSGFWEQEFSSSRFSSPLSLRKSRAAGSGAASALPQEIDAWLHIAENGKVTVYTGKVEVGQNIRTSLSQAVAEELHVPIDKIELVMGDTKLTPFDMGTFGSRTTPTMNLQLRKVAAAARETLIGLAAGQWKTDPAASGCGRGKDH